MIYAENILLCIAIPLVVSLVFVRGDARRYVGAFLAGMCMCLIAAYISAFLGGLAGLSDADTSVYLSPVVEETVKVFPLLYYIVLFLPGSRRQTMAAVAVGAGFATFENCCYILNTGAEYLAYVMIRGMAVGVMHIVSILALSIWLLAARRVRALSIPAVMGGVSLAVTFHALYNLLVSVPGLPSAIGYLMPLLTASALALLRRKLAAVLSPWN